MSVAVTGAVDGILTTVDPPAGFSVLCKQISSQKTWISHVYGTLSGQVWHLVVEATGYSAPGTYNAVITFGTVQPFTSTSTAPSPDRFAGAGTVTVDQAGASATISGTLTGNEARKVSVSGSLSCQTATTS